MASLRMRHSILRIHGQLWAVYCWEFAIAFFERVCPKNGMSAGLWSYTSQETRRI